LFSVWDRIEENVFAEDVTNALAKIFPDDPPRFLARTPHGYPDTALTRSNKIEANGEIGKPRPITPHSGPPPFPHRTPVILQRSFLSSGGLASARRRAER
jgi:hypothetical protein